VKVEADDVGIDKQPLQLSHHDDMDDDGLHPAARPSFICGLISFSAVASSEEACDMYAHTNDYNSAGVVSINAI